VVVVPVLPIARRLCAGLPMTDSLSSVPSGSFVVVFGADGVATRHVLREAAERGSHVLGWWRQQRRFVDDTGGSAGRDDVAGLVLLNVSGQDASLLLGTMDPTVSAWQPRPNRALLHDRHTGVSSVIVPYAVEPAQAGTQVAAPPAPRPPQPAPAGVSDE
jgi:hypothetical protein